MADYTVYNRALKYCVSTGTENISDYTRCIMLSIITEEFFHWYDLENNKMYQSPHSWLFTKCKEYYAKYSAAPSLDYYSSEVYASSLDQNQKLTALKVLTEISELPHVMLDEYRYHIDQLIDLYRSNKVMKTMQTCLENVQKDSEQAILYANRELTTIRRNTDVVTDPRRRVMFIDAFAAWVKQEYTNPDVSILSQVVNFGFDTWDKILGGMRAGELIVIVGTSNIGKSAVASEIAYTNAFEFNKRVVYANLEMTNEQILSRLLARQTGLPMRKLAKFGRLSPEEQALVMDKLSDMQDNFGKNLLLVDAEHCYTPDMLYGTIVEHFGAEQPDLIVVDYVDEMKGVNTKASIYEKIAENTSELKRLGAIFGCPVLTLSQGNRAAINNPNAGISEVANIGIMRKADMIMMLSEDPVNKYVPPAIGETQGIPGVLHAKVVKCRNEGKDYTFKLIVEFSTMSIQDASMLTPL